MIPRVMVILGGNPVLLFFEVISSEKPNINLPMKAEPKCILAIIRRPITGI
jgi:hypothetical protein